MSKIAEMLIWIIKFFHLTRIFRFDIVIRLIRKMDYSDERLTRAIYKEFYNIEIGKYTYGYRVKDIASGTSLGSFCSIADGVKLGQ